MSAQEKLLKRLQSNPKDFTWNELVRLLQGLGFEEKDRGKTGGARRKFFHASTKLIINVHKPHPSPILKLYLIQQIINKLKEEDLI